MRFLLSICNSLSLSHSYIAYLFIFQTSNSRLTTALFHSPLSFLPPCPSLHQIKQAHARITVIGLNNNGTIMGQLLAALAISPSTSSSYPRAVFQHIENPNIFASNNMIRCLSKTQFPRDSLLLYSTMRRTQILQPNNYTFPFVLQACAKALAIIEGAQIHSHIVKFGFTQDVYIRNALIHLYSACHETENSRKVFDESPQCRDIVTWNAILASYARDEQIDVTEEFFRGMPEKDVISWSTMIMGYVQGGQIEKGLECFREMREKKGLVPNEAILVTVLSASAQLGLLEHGQLVHSTIRSLNFPVSVTLGTALIDMYAKCGCIELSRQVFDKMYQKDVWSWNVMICGLATHGLGNEALALFQRFTNEGFRPVNVTFVGVLNACSRSGLVNEGRHYFKLMTEVYGIEPEMEHYGCMVDLLGRAGFVAEALELIGKMRVEPDPVLWGTLLGACKIHGLVEMGESLGKKLINLDPTHDGHYVLLANIYAKARKWEDVIRVRRLMVDRCANKVAGWSLIEARGKLHRFIADDREHQNSSEIYDMVKVIERRLGEAGYSPDVSSVLHDIGEEEKENVIRVHSERLAIAFGLLVTEVGSCIRIVKNLRVCGDCHEVCKMISNVFEREIVVRDGSRFHHFKRGRCSCLDYW